MKYYRIFYQMLKTSPFGFFTFAIFLLIAKPSFSSLLLLNNSYNNSLYLDTPVIYNPTKYNVACICDSVFEYLSMTDTVILNDSFLHFERKVSLPDPKIECQYFHKKDPPILSCSTKTINSTYQYEVRTVHNCPLNLKWDCNCLMFDIAEFLYSLKCTNTIDCFIDNPDHINFQVSDFFKTNDSLRKLTNKTKGGTLDCYYGCKTDPLCVREFFFYPEYFFGDFLEFPQEYESSPSAQVCSLCPNHPYNTFTVDSADIRKYVVKNNDRCNTILEIYRSESHTEPYRIEPLCIIPGCYEDPEPDPAPEPECGVELECLQNFFDEYVTVESEDIEQITEFYDQHIDDIEECLPCSFSELTNFEVTNPDSKYFTVTVNEACEVFLEIYLDEEKADLLTIHPLCQYASP